VTGARNKLPADIRKNINLIKRYARKPVCVGFGVSTLAQVRGIRKIADGVIIGSAIVKKIKENIHRADLIKKVSDFVARLKS
jgi:tryptophan synthase alpha chain